MASPFQLQERMLARIRASLGHPAIRSVPEKLPLFLSQAQASDIDKLSAEFEVEIKKVGGQVAQTHSGDEVKAYIEGLLPIGNEISVAVSDGQLIEELRIREWLLTSNTRVVTCPQGQTSMEEFKRDLLECGIGVTCADYALADTGTVVLMSGGEHHRLISLLPPVHVCLLPTDRMFASLTSLLETLSDESYARERPPHALTCITGPSRTADIEQTITTGVHGPKSLHVLLYSTETSKA